MPKYQTAKQLDILPQEHRALVAFVKSPTLGRIISVNGHAHYYDQGNIQDPRLAKENECGTAGCIAAFVFEHCLQVQGMKEVRSTDEADVYIDRACCNMNDLKNDPDPFDDDHVGHRIFKKLYGMGNGDLKLSAAQKVVEQVLLTGTVKFPTAKSAYIQRDSDI